jgi:hypothetical protein
MRRRVQGFMRRLQQHAGSVPYVYVLEQHKDGAWHAHLILGVYLRHAVVERLWGHGWVFVSKHGPRDGHLNQRETLRSVVRRAAGYVAKYVTKAYESGDGRHGYEVGQGFQPESVVIDGEHLGELLSDLRQLMGGGPPEVLWDSDQVPDWEGPRCLWGKWP